LLPVPSVLLLLTVPIRHVRCLDYTNQATKTVSWDIDGNNIGITYGEDFHCPSGALSFSLLLDLLALLMSICCALAITLTFKAVANPCTISTAAIKDQVTANINSILRELSTLLLTLLFVVSSKSR